MRRFLYLILIISVLCTGIIFSLSNKSKFEVDNFQQKIRKNPNEADEQYNLGLAYSILGRHNEAVTALEKAIDLNPNDAEAHFLLGHVYIPLCRNKEAAIVFKKAFSSHKIDASSTKLGLAYFTMGEYENALETLIQAKQNLEPHPGFIHYVLGITYYNLNKFQKAVETYIEALKINHDYTAKTHNMYYYLGQAYGRLGNYKMATKAYTQALVYRPDYVDTYFQLGFTNVMLNDEKSALKQLKILSKKDSNLAKLLAEYISQISNRLQITG